MIGFKETKSATFFRVQRPAAFSSSRRALLLGCAITLFGGCNGVPTRGVASGTRRYVGEGMSYDVFAELPSSTIAVPAGTIRVAFAPGELELAKARILRWIQSSAETVAAYYGRFPVDRVELLVVPVGGVGVRSGNAFAYRGATIRLRLGRRTREAQLDRDWVLVHEMVHLAFPSVNRRHHWVEEGLATYVEGVARAQAGYLSPDEVWAGFVDGMPNGLPQAGDRGLDNTPTWGRTYWGGAMFCLLADIRIRERTGNRKGLQDALRGILAAGGNMEVQWPVTKAFRVGDAATGVPVLTTLHQEMKDSPKQVDLASLWRRLGIVSEGKSVVFENDAPLATIRRAITSAPPVS